MRHIPFNQAWSVRPKVSSFAESVAGGADLFASLADQRQAVDQAASPSAAATVTEETGVNTALTAMWTFLETIMTSPVITEKTAEPFSYPTWRAATTWITASPSTWTCFPIG